MKMKKLLKILAGLIGVVLVVLAVGSLLLHIWLPPEKAKALVLKKLTGHLHREVRLGSVSVGLLSGLSVSDLRISESPDFSKGTFLSSDQFTLHVKLIPLIFRKVIGQLVLRRPVITIIRHSDGKTFNFSDLMASSNPPASASPSPAPAPELSDKKPSFALLIPRAEIDKGVIHFVDHSPEARSVDIDPIQLKLRNVSLVSPFTLQASLKAKAKRSEVALNLAAEANLLAGSFKIKNCAITSAGTQLSLGGRATALRSGKPNADVILDIKELNLASLQPFVPLPPELRVAGSITGNAHVKGDPNALNFDISADLTRADVSYGSLFKKPAKTALTFASKGTVIHFQKATVTALQASLGSLKLTGHGSAQGLTAPQPNIAFHMETNSFPIDELVQYAAGFLPKGLIVKGNTSLAADLSGTTALSRVAAKWQGTDLAISMANQFDKPAGIPLQASFVADVVNQQTVNFKSLTAKLASLEATGDGSYKMAGAGSFTLSLKTNAWKVQELASLLPSLADYHAAGTAAVEARAFGSPGAPALNGFLTLQDVSARYERSALARLAGAVNFTQQDVAIPRLTGQLNGSDFTLKLTGRRLTTQPDVHVEANFTELDLDKLLPPLGGPSTVSSRPLAPAVAFAFVAPVYAAAPVPSALGPMKIAAHLTVGNIKHELYQAQNLDFRCDLTDLTPDLSRVSGTAHLKQGAGKLQNLEKLAALSKGARLALLPLTTIQKLDKRGLLKSAGLPSLQSIRFSGLRGDYALRAGTMDVQLFELVGQDLELQTKGAVGLAGAQPLNMRVTVKLASGLVGGDLGRLLQDENGRATLHLAATGSVADPHVRLEMQEAGRRAVQQIGGQLLKGLGVGPSSDGSTPAPNPIDDLQKSLKNIFR